VGKNTALNSKHNTG